MFECSWPLSHHEDECIDLSYLGEMVALRELVINNLDVTNFDSRRPLELAP